MYEKAITSLDYKLYAKLLDMSKAFDSVRRKILLNDLKEILDNDEYYQYSINNISNNISTNPENLIITDIDINNNSIYATITNVCGGENIIDIIADGK